MAEQIHTKVAESCPVIASKPEQIQKVLWDAFENAVASAEKHGISEEEIFQFLEDIIDHRASEKSIAEMEHSGEQPKTLDEIEREMGL